MRNNGEQVQAAHMAGSRIVDTTYKYEQATENAGRAHPDALLAVHALFRVLVNRDAYVDEPRAPVAVGDAVQVVDDGPHGSHMFARARVVAIPTGCQGAGVYQVTVERRSQDFHASKLDVHNTLQYGSLKLDLGRAPYVLYGVKSLDRTAP